MKERVALCHAYFSWLVWKAILFANHKRKKLKDTILLVLIEEISCWPKKNKLGWSSNGVIFLWSTNKSSKNCINHDSLVGTFNNNLIRTETVNDSWYMIPIMKKS